MLQLSWRRMLLPHGKQMLKSFRKLIQLIRWVQAQAAKLPCPARPLTLPPLNSNYATSLAPSPLRPNDPLESVTHKHTHHHRSTVPQRSSCSGFSNLTHICRLPKFSEGYYFATATLATSTATATRTATRATAATSNEATATAEATISASAS